jgi:hypothetical protein
MSNLPATPATSWPEPVRAEHARLETAFATWWPEPEAPRRWLPAAAAGAGLVAALIIPGAPRPGIDLLLSGLAAASPVAVLAYQRGRRAGRRRPIGPIAVSLGVIAIGLAAVSAVRASEWLAWGCAAAALCLAAAVALDVRRWYAVLGTLPLFGVAMLRALPWAGPAARVDRFRISRPWLTGGGVGLACAVAVGGLLASADEAFADLLTGFWPTVDLGLLPARGLMFIAATGTVLGALFAVSTTLTLPRPAESATSASASASGSGEGRHPAEWLTPVVLVAVIIAAFLAFEATALFGGAEVVQKLSTVTPAERARQGFGQLSVVTLIVLALLAWSGHAAAAGPARHRRLMAAGGGVLLVLALLLGGSALRRLWLYQDALGWTVTRLNAGAFEVWVVVVLVGIALAWLLKRTDLMPRFLAGSAGLGLLVLAMLGPDALVATANVDRFAPKSLDTAYLSQLSDDAVPALYRLPEPQRSCVLAGRTPTEDPWFGWNLSRSRANELLIAQPPIDPEPGQC